MLSVNEINLLQAQNEGLKKQNADLQKENTELKAWLQDIKAIATECTTCGDCSNCKYDEHCYTDIEAQALGVCRMILEKITKAESEG